MRIIPALLALIIAVVSAVPQGAVAADPGEPGWRSVGVRAGFASGGQGNDLVQVEGDAVYRLPWSWHGAHWQVLTQAEGSLGMLTAHDQYGVIAAAGPSVALSNLHCPVELAGGISAAFLSRDTFGGKDYNGDAQFISHVGLNYHVSRHFGLSYRFQHMSNAGLNGRHNPGVNEHLFGLDWYHGQ